MRRVTIPVVPLTRSAFAPFGEVVEMDGAALVTINQGFARRANGLATIDVASQGGVVNISLFDAKVRPQPIVVTMMERHPIASQLFYPLQDQPWLVVVCADPHVASSYRAFRASGQQGVNYFRNVWHHPLLAARDGDRFLVVDRGADRQANLDEVALDPARQLELAADALSRGD